MDDSDINEPSATLTNTPAEVLEKTVPVTPDTQPEPPPAVSSGPKGSAFWLSHISLILSSLLSALDLTALGTALPTITQELNASDDFAWVGSAYALATTAFLPLSGNLADIFGRRPTMLLCIALFCLGSALAGSAQSMTWLIAARTIQGLGGGGILNISEILIGDLVPLAERGMYQGFLVLTWAFSSAIGPLIGGSLAQKASWRWIFYLNLPISGIAFVFVLFFLRVKTPRGDIWSKLSSVDWFGNLIIIAGATLRNIGLAWAGVRYSWSDAHALAPLIIGIFLVGVFLVYERYVPRIPTVPWDIITNWTTLSAFLGTFFHGITSITLIYYLPTYFQAVLEASPIRSAVDFFPFALLVAPSSMAMGIAVTVYKKYVPGNYIGWILSTVGFGILSLMKPDSSTGQWVGYQIVVAIGIGIIYAGTTFPLLAPLSVGRTASALAFLGFIRSFAQIWGITLSATILQNELKSNLPAEFTAHFPAGTEIAYSLIGIIPELPEPLRQQVKVAFADSMQVIWQTMTGISGLGLLSVLLMKEVKMAEVTDDKFALKDDKKKKGEEV